MDSYSQQNLRSDSFAVKPLSAACSINHGVKLSAKKYIYTSFSHIFSFTFGNSSIKDAVGAKANKTSSGILEGAVDQGSH